MAFHLRPAMHKLKVVSNQTRIYLDTFLSKFKNDGRLDQIPVKIKNNLRQQFIFIRTPIRCRHAAVILPRTTKDKRSNDLCLAVVCTETGTPPLNLQGNKLANAAGHKVRKADGKGEQFQRRHEAEESASMPNVNERPVYPFATGWSLFSRTT